MLQMTLGRQTSGARFVYTYVGDIQGLILVDWLVFGILQSVSVLERNKPQHQTQKGQSSW